MSDKDWAEDSKKDGEIYITMCIKCGNEFTGHKKRIGCKTYTSAAKAKASSPTYGIDRVNKAQAITKDGHTMFPEDVVYDLKALKRKVSDLNVEIERYREAVWWAMGLRGDFGPFESPFGWRGELFKRCGLIADKVNTEAQRLNDRNH